MLNRSHACVALMFCGSLAYAQDASTPPANTGVLGSGAPSSLTPFATPEVPTLQTQTLENQTLETPAIVPGASVQTTGTEAQAATDETEGGFALPGGYGYAPLNFVPGQGRFNQKPISFSTTLQQGYDDNIYSSSGKPGDEPVKGSTFTNLSQGVDILFSQSRMGLSLQANGGGQYYYDRSGDQLTPTAGANLLFAYKLTPRAQFSSVINGVYTTQPSLTVLNGLIQSNGKGYFTINSKFDLLYQWTERFSTDTTYTLVSTNYSDSTQSSSDCLTQTIGQSVRYLYSRRLTGVVEVRASQTSYDSSLFDSNTYYFLGGADLILSRRLSASFRAGGTITDYDNDLIPNQSAPYIEGSLDYNLSRVEFLSFNGRYGTNTGSASNQVNSKSTRLGVSYAHTFSPKLRGTLSVNYDHQDGGSGDNALWQFLSNSNGKQDAISGTAGVEYAFSQKLSVFANYNHFEVFNASNDLNDNSRNIYNLGASYKY